MNKVFNVVEKQIKKNLDYRVKEYSPAYKIKYEIDLNVLVFNPKRKSDEAAKLKIGWSLPFILTKKLNDVCFEIKSLAWAHPKFKVVRSISHLKPYLGPTNFKKVKRQLSPVEFMAKHQFELLKNDDEFIMNDQPSSSRKNQRTNETIRLPLGSWILRDRIT